MSASKSSSARRDLRLRMMPSSSSIFDWMRSFSSAVGSMGATGLFCCAPRRRASKTGTEKMAYRSMSLSMFIEHHIGSVRTGELQPTASMEVEDDGSLLAKAIVDSLVIDGGRLRPAVRAVMLRDKALTNRCNHYPAIVLRRRCLRHYGGFRRRSVPKYQER